MVYANSVFCLPSVEAQQSDDLEVPLEFLFKETVAIENLILGDDYLGSAN